jgi:YqjK-like protein
MSRPREQLVEIRLRRQQLSARAAAQRTAVAVTFEQLSAPLGVVDRVVVAARFVRAHPVLFGVGVAAVVAMLRGSVVRMLPTVGRGLAAWRILRVVSDLLMERQRSRETVSK